MIFTFIVQLFSVIAGDVISKQDANKFLHSNSEGKVRSRRSLIPEKNGEREEDYEEDYEDELDEEWDEMIVMRGQD